jgi:hypothetical protein
MTKQFKVIVEKDADGVICKKPIHAVGSCKINPLRNKKSNLLATN